MSESDDTDILLLIPPDLFTVASSPSESSLSRFHPNENGSVMTEILDHVQLLEDRISAIESRDTSLMEPIDVPDFMSDKPSLMGQLSSQRKSPLRSGNFSLNPNSSVPNAGGKPENEDKLVHSTGESYGYSPSTRLSKQKFSHDTSFESLRSRMISENELISSNLEQRQKMFRNGTEQSFNFKSPKKIIEKNEGLRRNLSEKFNEFDEKKIEKYAKSPKKLESVKSSLFMGDHSGDNKYGVKSLNGSQLSISGDSNTQKINKPETTTSSKVTNDFPMNSEYQTWQSQKLMSLSDFWMPNSNKSEEEMLHIKLEEEKFRREHCENLIQDLQKRLLEQQEKVAVAMRVDEEKSGIISEFQTIWTKCKERWQILEGDHNRLQTTMHDLKKKHQEEILELQSQLMTKSEELKTINKALNDCQEKYDTAVKEKISLLESHTNELENYKSLVQIAENRYETLKVDYDKLNEIKAELETNNKGIQADLYKECLRNSEVRNEMSVIHKALDTCEAELIVLRQEKENLSLKLKEEENRNSILEKKKMMLLEDVENAQKSEAAVKEEITSIVAQQESKKSELRQVYQKQVDEVVNTKLKEFQAQLDAAELNFQIELDTKQRAIAECAARKIKSMIDKHQLEVNLLEEKHNEEKRLYEIRLSQTTKKALTLEAHLNAQQDAKTRLAGQLHSLMEKQYQQALKIITTGNDMEKCNQKQHRMQNSNNYNGVSIDANRFVKKPYESGISYLEPVKLGKSDRKQMDYQEMNRDHNESLMTFVSSDESPSTKLESQDDLKKYIQMFLQTQQPKNHFLDINAVQNQSNSPPVCREVPRKYYMKVEAESSNDEGFSRDNTEKNAVDYPDRDRNKCSDEHLRIAAQETKHKPPWK